MMRYELAAVIPMVLFGVVACSKNRDDEAKKVIEELSALDDAVEEAVRTSPDDAGLAKAEGLVAAKGASLRARLSSLTSNSDGDPSMALSNACVSKNMTAAKNAQGYVYNAVLKTKPELRARATKLARAVCDICEPVLRSTACATFRETPEG